MVKKCDFKGLQKLSLLTLESLRLSGNEFQASNRESPSAVSSQPVSRKDQESSTGGPEMLLVLLLNHGVSVLKLNQTSRWQCFSSCLLWSLALAIARVRLPLYFTAVFYLFIFSLATLSQTSENRHHRNFPTRRGLVFNRTFAIAIFSKCSLKRTGAEKHKIYTIFFIPSRRQSAP